MGDSYPLVLSPAQLHATTTSAKSPTDLAVLDATWFMPNVQRNAQEEFTNAHIPSAQFLDIDRVASSHPLSLPHMMPDASLFSRACASLGIEPSTHVVIYDTHGVFSAPRALYMFRSFGHARSSILDGGLPAWRAHGGKTESGPPKHPERVVYPSPELNEAAVKDYAQITANAECNPERDSNAFYVVDARSRGRFLGTDPEPRPGLSSGHMPHALSLPFTAFLETHTLPDDTTYTRMRSTQAILNALEEALGPERTKEVLEGRREIVASCGSGMSAGVIWLGLKLLGVERAGLYDESWTGYAMRPESRIVKGE